MAVAALCVLCDFAHSVLAISSHNSDIVCALYRWGLLSGTSHSSPPRSTAPPSAPPPVYHSPAPQTTATRSHSISSLPLPLIWSLCCPRHPSCPAPCPRHPHHIPPSRALTTLRSLLTSSVRCVTVLTDSLLTF